MRVESREAESRVWAVEQAPVLVGNRKRRAAGRIATVVVMAVMCLSGCTKYPQVAFENLEYVAALRTACSAKNAEWLAKTKAEIEKEHAGGTLGDEEYAAYGGIVATAEAGEWEEAEAECLRFQKDQLAE